MLHRIFMRIRWYEECKASSTQLDLHLVDFLPCHCGFWGLWLLDFMMCVVMVLGMVSSDVSCSVVLGERKRRLRLGAGTGYLATCQTQGYLISLAHLIFPGFSLPTGQELRVFQGGLNVRGMMTNVSKESSQEMNLPLCKEKMDLVVRSERESLLLGTSGWVEEQTLQRIQSENKSISPQNRAEKASIHW